MIANIQPPTFKLERSSKIQVPTPFATAGAWILELLWMLDLESWMLAPSLLLRLKQLIQHAIHRRLSRRRLISISVGRSISSRRLLPASEQPAQTLNQAARLFIHSRNIATQLLQSGA